ncbi:hypothetical protein C2G38_1750008 [Gigaspora rosea]|uniref:TLC domain-containing protein n=1 Tax=Gigaspora rosea TaxID=44941 RepID=A0A397UTX5_9GLOM|nr:hypothetical protein C2G38_1750008 [Gigaspora rosea]
MKVRISSLYVSFHVFLINFAFYIISYFLAIHYPIIQIVHILYSIVFRHILPHITCHFTFIN